MEPQHLPKQSGDEPDMMVIPAGIFWMGTRRRRLKKTRIGWWDWMRRETPCHQRRLPAYAIGRHPVTNAEYANFIADNGYFWREFWTAAGWEIKSRYRWTEPGYWTEKRWNPPTCPVVGVSWYECVAYCHWLNKTTDRPFRLPTEAEWEKAARGTEANLWPWGNTWQPESCNNWEIRLRRTTPAGRFSPVGDTPFGVADMVGNVWEWCATKSAKSYPYNLETDEWQLDCLAGTEARMLRGGSWGCIRNLARCAYRERHQPGSRFSDCGCRLALSL